MMDRKKYGVLIILSVTLLFACVKDEITDEVSPIVVPTLPTTLYDYESAYDFPDHVLNDPILSLIAGNFEPSSNPLTNEGATLGRVLFYDKKLSADETISCSSCHVQSHGFSDPNIVSTGINGQQTDRNSMQLYNLRFNSTMFWDFRTNGLENQIPIPIENPIEMGISMGDLVVKLSGVDYYPALFEDAFGDSEITSERIARALSQFVRSITSFNSKYDQGIDIGFSNYSALENEGRELFFSGELRCNHCHSTQNFYSLDAMNNGLDEEYADQGQYLATGNESDKGEFKVPSLRNIEYSAPYMHDGRFASLEEVVEHYSTGVHAHPNLNDRITEELMTGGTPVLLNLTDQEKEALIAFLKTLSEPELLTDVRYSNPFQ